MARRTRKALGDASSMTLPEPKKRAPKPENMISPGQSGCLVDPSSARSANPNFCFDVGGGNELRPVPASAPNASGVSKFYAANLKNVCRVKKVAASCFVRGTEASEKPRKLKAWGKDTKYADVVLNEAEKKVACDEAGGAFIGTFEESLRSGKLELDLLSPAQANEIVKEYKVPVKPGAALRLCFADKEKGVAVNVESPEQAVAVRDAYRACLASSKGKDKTAAAKKCAVDTAKKFGSAGKALFGVGGDE